MYMGEFISGQELANKDCNRPEDPLRVLGEFLLQKSKEFEGSK